MAFIDLVHQKPNKLSSSAMQSRSLLATNHRNVAKFATAAAGAIHDHHHHHEAKASGLVRNVKAAFGPMGAVIGIIGGFVGMACIIGIHTAKQQLLYSPSVQVTKKRREMIPEVDIPDAVMRSSDKFLGKSFLRKVGHIQDNHNHNMNGSTPTPRAPESHTLKSVGIRN